MFGSAWVVIGGFNCLLDESNHWPERVHRSDRFEELSDGLTECGLSDLLYSSSRHTWTNMRIGERRITEKIDQVLVNDAWLISFPDSRVVFDCPDISDHSPCRVFIF